MALQIVDLTDLNAISAQALFPTVTTWIGFPKDTVLRSYMKEFIALFAPHWPHYLIERAIKAETQAIVDTLAETLDLPTWAG